MTLSITSGQYVYIAQQPLGTYAAEQLAAKVYNMLLWFRMGPSKVAKVSRTTVPIHEDGIRNGISMDWSTLVLSAITADSHDENRPNKPFNELENNVDTWKGHSTAEELSDGFREYAVDRIQLHVGRGDLHKSFVRWNDYGRDEKTLRLLDHILEHLTTPYWRQRQDNQEVW